MTWRQARALAAEVAALDLAIYQAFTAPRRTPESSGLTQRTIGVLQHLTAVAPVSVTELAGQIGSSKAATTELLDRMERKDLVARSPDAEDGRRVVVTLTERGGKAAAAHPATDPNDRLAAALLDITPTEREHLVEGLRALAAAGRRGTRPAG
jgi:DNA-binding MarR family transcriptional regulator